MSSRAIVYQNARLIRQILHDNATNARHISIFGSSKKTEWKKAVSDAEKVVGYPTSFMSLRCLLSDEMANVAIQTRKLIGTKHPLLKTARAFLANGKHSLQTRGLIVLLVAKAAGPGSTSDLHEMVSGIYPKQRTLAEVTEMIYTANLIHKGVVNLQTVTPEDGAYKDMEFGNKIAVLSGDFLLASASTSLADLENTRVVELISRAIADLTKAEFTMLRDENGHATKPDDVTFSDWENQTYLQSGSLLSKSCKASMELVGHNEQFQQAAARFGEYITYARQLQEDLSPFTHANNDHNGLLASAPVIRHTECSYSHIQNNQEPREIIDRVRSQDSLQWCIEKCKQYGLEATSAINVFPSSDAKQALLKIVQATTNL